LVRDGVADGWSPAAGEPAAAGTGLAQLYTQHRAALLRFLRARCGDAAEAEDVLQELWVKLQAHPTGPIANGRAYLFQSANHLVLDRVRERRRRARRDRQWAESVQLGQAVEGEVAAPAPTPPELLEEAEQLRNLDAALASLPDGARRAFCLHKLEGLAHAEVAARLGISRSGVEKHVAVAMRHLRRALLD
jgi:RNA polymerase sigma factor (sigma-70 family)